MVVQSPNTITLSRQPSVFLAGGISNCSNWQNDVIKELIKYDDLIIFNPRRDNFNVNDPSQSQKQIEWEYNYLLNSTMISMWFSYETIQPICLYELGMWINSRKKPAVIGIHPEYSRKDDIIIQTNLSRPNDNMIKIAIGWESFIEELHSMINIII